MSRMQSSSSSAAAVSAAGGEEESLAFWDSAPCAAGGLGGSGFGGRGWLWMKWSRRPLGVVATTGAGLGFPGEVAVAERNSSSSEKLKDGATPWIGLGWIGLVWRLGWRFDRNGWDGV